MITNSEWWCETNKVDAIFVCPKSCGFCAILWRMVSSARLWTVSIGLSRRSVERAVGYALYSIYPYPLTTTTTTTIIKMMLLVRR